MCFEFLAEVELRRRFFSSHRSLALRRGDRDVNGRRARPISTRSRRQTSSAVRTPDAHPVDSRLPTECLQSGEREEEGSWAARETSNRLCNKNVNFQLFYWLRPCGATLSFYLKTASKEHSFLSVLPVNSNAF